MGGGQVKKFSYLGGVVDLNSSRFNAFARRDNDFTGNAGLLMQGISLETCEVAEMIIVSLSLG